MKPYRDIAFADAECKRDVLDWHVFEIEAGHRFEIVREPAHSLEQTCQLHRVGGCVFQGRGRVRQVVTEWLGLPHDGAPHVGDADILRDPGNIGFEHDVIFQARQSLPHGKPNILHQIIHPVGIAFVHSGDATHHGGMDFDDLFKFDHALKFPLPLCSYSYSR